jgi:recombinational DNA repair protein RecR
MTNKTHYQNLDIAKISNCIDAEQYVRGLCLELNGSHDSEWCKNYFINTFPRLTKVKMGRILLGLEIGNKQNYYYTPNPF